MCIMIIINVAIMIIIIVIIVQEVEELHQVVGGEDLLAALGLGAVDVVLLCCSSLIYSM